MNKVLILAAAAVIGFAPLAGAVDVVNEDEAPVVVTVDDGQTAKEIEIGGGESAKAVCESCMVQFGEDAVEADGDQVVKVKDGKLSVGG